MTSYTGGVTKTYFAISDHLNSIHAMADETGSIVESYRFDAWGRVLGVYNGSGQPLTESAIGNRFLWACKEYSFKTGLYHNRARTYDPITGRFLSKDPSGISGGLNTYLYCLNNPVNFVDSTGLDMHKVEFKGKTVKIDDAKITPQGVGLEIKQMTETIGLLEKVAAGEATFKELGLGAVANAATGADKRYGTECQQYLRSSFESKFKLGAFGWEEGGSRVLFSVGAGEDVLKSDTVTPGMAQTAENAKKRAQTYLDFVNKVQSSVYPPKPPNQ